MAGNLVRAFSNCPAIERIDLGSCFYKKHLLAQLSSKKIRVLVHYRCLTTMQVEFHTKQYQKSNRIKHTCVHRNKTADNTKLNNLKTSNSYLLHKEQFHHFVIFFFKVGYKMVSKAMFSSQENYNKTLVSLFQNSCYIQCIKMCNSNKYYGQRQHILLYSILND